MLIEQEVIEIAKNHVKKQSEKVDMILSSWIMTKLKPYGIIFKYNTKKFNQTRDYNDKTLIGNTPFLVENKTGKIIIFGFSQGLDYYIEEYEAGRWPDMPRLSDFQ